MKPLSANQLGYLKDCAIAPRNSWGVGAATVSSLRKLGFIRADKSTGTVFNVITPAGIDHLRSIGVEVVDDAL